MSDPVKHHLVRRRRTWYRRRLRKRRVFAATLIGLAIAIGCWQNAINLLSPHAAGFFSASGNSFGGRRAWQESGFVPAHAAKHAYYVNRVPGVYPYSVIPGGVRNPQSLRQAAARDRAVAHHFAHFDYDQAHLVRLSAPRDVFVSYRIRDTVFWTQKRIHLAAGEMLLTDGKITARAKCGNQISDTAKPEVSKEEPEEDILDQEVALEPLSPALPLRILGTPDLPAGEPVAPKLFAGNFGFPYVPYGLPMPPRNCAFEDVLLNKHCQVHKKTTTPEPSTFLLLATGLATLAWGYRRFIDGGECARHHI